MRYVPAPPSVLDQWLDGDWHAPEQSVRFRLGSPGLFITLGDFDGDGILDIAVANADRAISLLLGNGDGTFQPAKNFGAASPFVAMGDFNGDGRPDLAVVNYVASGISVLINDTPR